MAILSGSAFPRRLSYGIEPQEAVEDVVGEEQCQSTEQADQCRNSQVVVQRLVYIQLDMALRIHVCWPLTSNLTSARKGNARHATMKRSK